jgi:hypothetical protein
MGGHAFVSEKKGKPGLFCPRLPLEVYEAIRDQTVNKLKEHFEHVVVPIEHPEKKDYGDIDLLVCSPIGESMDFGAFHINKYGTVHDLKFCIAKALGTDRFYSNAVGVGYFAVKVPKEIIALGKISEVKEDDNQLGSHEEYWVQVDIEVVDVPSQLGWRVFQNAHSTMCNILRLGLRPAGFIFKPSGLYIQIPNEPKYVAQEKRCPLIFLSNDIDMVLRFFDLTPERYNRPFEYSELYWKWVTSIPFFSRELLLSDVELPKSEKDKAVDNIAMKAKAKHKGLLGLSDYIARRAPWVNFSKLWLPDHPEVGLADADPKYVFRSAIRFFTDDGGAHMGAYDDWEEESNELRFWHEVIIGLRKFVGPNANTKLINEMILGAKRWVVFVDVQGKGKTPTIRAGPEPDDFNHFKWLSVTENVKWLAESREGGFTSEELIVWIQVHSNQLREIERARTRPHRREAAARSEEKKRQKAMRATVVGKILCGTTGCVKKVLTCLIDGVDFVENWWKMKQNVRVWKEEIATSDT